MPEGTDDDIDGSDTDSIFDEDDDVMMPLSIRMDSDVNKLKTNTGSIDHHDDRIDPIIDHL